MSAPKYLPLLLASTVIGLGACSTVQENPNYQYSSKYGVTDTVQTVQTEPVETHQAPVVTVSNPGTAVSPTEEAYNADAMTGTPGYAILLAEEAETNAQPQTTPHTLPVPAPVYDGPREVDYDYAQNVIVTEVPQAVSATAAPEPTRTAVTAPTGQSYIVQPGDTVYSLSRRICAPIAEIMTVNGIGADYAIAIGQTLILPATRC